MRYQRVPDAGPPRSVWDLAANQHGVVTRSQLLDLGYSSREIAGRRHRGRLHVVRRGVYAVGRPALTRRGAWMAAVLASPDGAVLSHASAAALWNLSPEGPRIEISLPRRSRSRQPGIVAHRPVTLDAADLTRRHNIPVTVPVRTLIDIAGRLPARKLEAVVNRADKLDLVDPERLLEEVDERAPFPGATKLRALLDHATFRRTDSELERMFLRLVRGARLPVPETQVRLNGYTVDFYWPGSRLVVETDGLRYHRTATTQARDAQRDRAHALAGLTTMRFTHAEVSYEPEAVAATLAGALHRLER